MPNRMTAKYSNLLGSVEVNQKQNINFRQTIRVVKANGIVKGERCPNCSSFQFKKGKGIVPSLNKNFSHKKGCRLA